MAGEYTRCPHCECKVKISEVEAEDGFCPECGQLVMESVFGKIFDDEIEDNSDMDGAYNEENDNDDEYVDDDINEPDILDELNDDDMPIDDDLEEEEGASAPKRSRGGFGGGKGRSSRRRK